MVREEKTQPAGESHLKRLRGLESSDAVPERLRLPQTVEATVAGVVDIHKLRSWMLHSRQYGRRRALVAPGKGLDADIYLGTTSPTEVFPPHIGRLGSRGCLLVAQHGSQVVLIRNGRQLREIFGLAGLLCHFFCSRKSLPSLLLKALDHRLAKRAIGGLLGDRRLQVCYVLLHAGDGEDRDRAG